MTERLYLRCLNIRPLASDEAKFFDGSIFETKDAAFAIAISFGESAAPISRVEALRLISYLAEKLEDM